VHDQRGDQLQRGPPVVFGNGWARSCPNAAVSPQGPETGRGSGVGCSCHAAFEGEGLAYDDLARGVHGITKSISHECIYQAIYNSCGLAAGLHGGLYLKRRRRKHRGRPAPGSHSLGSFNPISARPAVADHRVEVGHLEGDLIVGAYNRSALITLFDRTSRHLWLAAVANKTADATYNSLCRTLQRIPPALRRTLTWDQGAEIARHHDITKRCGINIYIADAHSPWQRPTNENGNALVRRYVGKGTNLNTYTPRQLQAIEHRINTIPRRSLNWATAHDTYTPAVAMTD